MDLRPDPRGNGPDTGRGGGVRGHGRAHGAALRATQLDPLEPEARGNLALAHLGLGDVEACRDEAHRILDTHPSFTYALWMAAMAEHLLGQHDRALAHLIRLQEPRFSAWTPLSRGLGHIATGREAQARTALAELKGGDAPFKTAVLAAALGDDEGFFRLLESAGPLFWDEALALRYWRLPALERLRGDARFQDRLQALDRRWGVGDD